MQVVVPILSKLEFLLLYQNFKIIMRVDCYNFLMVGDKFYRNRCDVMCYTLLKILNFENSKLLGSQWKIFQVIK